MQDYLVDEYIKITYHLTTQSVVVQWIFPPTTRIYEEGMNHIGVALSFFESHKLLYNPIGLSIFSPEEQWSMTEWLKMAAQAHCSFIAFIGITKISSASNMDLLSVLPKRPVIFSHFKDQQEALKWLQKQ